MGRDCQTLKETVQCKICGREFRSLVPRHLKFSHDIEVEEYIRLYGGDTQSEYTRYIKSNTPKEKWRDSDFRSSMLEAINKAKRDPVNRSKKADEMSRRWEDDRDLMMSNMERGKTLEWRSKISQTMKENWKDPEHRRKTMESQGSISSLHREVSDYLSSLGIDHINEKYFRASDLKSVRVDIYIPSIDLIIEVNGEYWHGKPGEFMTPQQSIGFSRDELKRSLFDNIVFLWETDILNGSYRVILNDLLGGQIHG